MFFKPTVQFHHPPPSPTDHQPPTMSCTHNGACANQLSTPQNPQNQDHVLLTNPLLSHTPGKRLRPPPFNHPPRPSRAVKDANPAPQIPQPPAPALHAAVSLPDRDGLHPAGSSTLTSIMHACAATWYSVQNKQSLSCRGTITVQHERQRRVIRCTPVTSNLEQNSASNPVGAIVILGQNRAFKSPPTGRDRINRCNVSPTCIPEQVAFLCCRLTLACRLHVCAPVHGL